jgi:hypothetical protein
MYANHWLNNTRFVKNIVMHLSLTLVPTVDACGSVLVEYTSVSATSVGAAICRRI